MTTNFGVVGSPISQSLSPVLHNSAYSFLGLDFDYGRFDVPAHSLSDFVAKGHYSGLSVTMPLKREAFDLASRAEGDAAITKVANTLVFSGREWIAHNTDVFGISKALSELSYPERIHVLGSGSTARSAVLALAGLFPNAEITIMARNEQHSRELKLFGEELGLTCYASAFDVPAVVDSDLVLSLVPAGALDSFWRQVERSRQKPSGVLFDSSYNPWPSMAANVWGPNSISGISMLIWQAIAQVQLFVESQGIVVSFDSDKLAQVMTSAIEDR